MLFFRTSYKGQATEAISRFPAIAAGLIFLLMACSADKSENQVESDPNVMARIGQHEVTDEEFLGAFRHIYERSGRALQVTSTMLREILDQRVHFYGAVQYGIDMGWDSDYEGLYRKNLIYRQVVMDEFKRSMVETRVDVTDEDLRELFLKYNTHVRASHLYAPDRHVADSLHALVTAGASFEDLAARIFEAPSLRDTGGDLGYFTVDEMDVGFESVAFSLPVGAISEPVRTSRGFSIIKVTDRITTPIITEYQFAEKKNRIRELAIRQQTELERRADMDRVIDGFEFDEALLAELWDRVEGHLDRTPEPGIESDHLFHMVPESWHNKPLALHDGFELNVAMFLLETWYTPQEARDPVRTAGAFRNLAEAIAYRTYAMHQYLTSPAYDEDLIARSVGNTFQNYLNRRLSQSLRENAVMAEEDKRREFLQHPDVYIHPREVNLAELAVRDMDTAEKALHKLEEGADFLQVLHTYGFDEEAKLAGGEIGFTPVTHFGSISPALSRIQPGDIAGPFEMASDVIFLFKCLGVREARPMSYEEALPHIREQLAGAHVMEERNRLVSETLERHDARVYYNRINEIRLQL